MSNIILAGSISGEGTMTVQAPATSGNRVLTLEDTDGTLAPLVSGTAQTASGTSVDFTGIPSWAKRITVMFSGVSTSGNSNQIIQFGTGATPTYTTSGYLGSCSTSTGATITAFSTGFMINNSASASTVVHGIITFIKIIDNTWCESGALGLSDSTNTRLSAGSVSLSDTLTAIKITTAGGTFIFDAGTINIMYE
jgi:hypothetical protein